MEFLEIFDRIINKDLRPHIYSNNGKRLEEILNVFYKQQADCTEYINYLTKLGRKYELKITDPKTKEVIISTTVNKDLNTLYDIDIPPEPNRKGELYLELIEYSFIINKIQIEKYFNNTEINELNLFAVKHIQIVKELYRDLKTYKKLVIIDEKMSWEDGNYYVIYLANLFLERMAYYILELFKPFIGDKYYCETMHFFFGELQELLKGYEVLNKKTEPDQISDLKRELISEQNKRRTFPIELLRKTKEIEEREKKSIPKPTQVDCIILANRELKKYDEADLLDKGNNPTQFLLSIRDTYKAQKKTL